VLFEAGAQSKGFASILFFFQLISRLGFIPAVSFAGLPGEARLVEGQVSCCSRKMCCHQAV